MEAEKSPCLSLSADSGKPVMVNEAENFRSRVHLGFTWKPRTTRPTTALLLGLFVRYLCPSKRLCLPEVLYGKAHTGHSSHDALRRRRLPDASDRNEVKTAPHSMGLHTSALPESSQEQHSLQLPRQHLTLFYLLSSYLYCSKQGTVWLWHKI